MQLNSNNIPVWTLVIGLVVIIITISIIVMTKSLCLGFHAWGVTTVTHSTSIFTGTWPGPYISDLKFVLIH